MLKGSSVLCLIISTTDLHGLFMAVFNYGSSSKYLWRFYAWRNMIGLCQLRSCQAANQNEWQKMITINALLAGFSSEKLYHIKKSDVFSLGVLHWQSNPPTCMSPKCVPEQTWLSGQERSSDSRCVDLLRRIYEWCRLMDCMTLI